MNAQLLRLEARDEQRRLDKNDFLLERNKIVNRSWASAAALRADVPMSA